MRFLRLLRLLNAVGLYCLLKFVRLDGLAAKLDAHATENGWGC